MFRQLFCHVRNFAFAVLAAASLLGAGNALAAFPERPITLIVPWAAGGGNADKVEKLPRKVRLGVNTNAFEGGFRLWKKGLVRPPGARAG